MFATFDLEQLSVRQVIVDGGDAAVVGWARWRVTASGKPTGRHYRWSVELERVEELAPREGWRYVHSANEPHLIAGVGTLAIEILDELPEVDYSAIWAQLFGRLDYRGARTQMITFFGADERYQEVQGGELVDDSGKPIFGEGENRETSVVMP